MKQVNTEYNFWLSGYYDDFASARAIADDQNPATYRDLDHTISHFGSVIGSFARLNPRFKFTYPERVFGTVAGYMTADPGADENDSYYQLTGGVEKLAHNSGLAEWATRDFVADNTESFSARSVLQHPISICANRQKFNGVAGDNYLMFRNGHESQGVYYASVGEMDFSYGLAPVSRNDTSDLSTSANYNKSAGNPVSYYQKGLTRHTGDDTHDTPDKTMATVAFAGVYTGEQPTLVKSATKPTSYLHEIKSPSNMPFLIHQQYIERGDGVSSPSTANGTQRLLSYDGPLRFKGIGESFHLRLSAHKISEFTLTKYQLKIGYKSTASFNKSTGDFSDTQVLITVPITLTNLGINGNPLRFNTGEGAELPYDENSIWADIEIVPDFVLNTWKAYANGNTTEFANGSINISGHDMASAIGWSLDLVWAHDSDTHVSLTTMIDRAGVALPLTNKFDGNTVGLPTVNSFNINYGANRISSADIQILDDSNAYTLAPLTTGTASTEWRMLMFESAENRPIWWGNIEAVDHQQGGFDNTLKTTIRARDSFSILDRTLPIWEMGQSAFFSLSNHLSMTTAYQKKAGETSAIADTLLFGLGHLRPKKSEIGFTRNDSDTATRYSAIFDSRQSLFSSALIQMYINEDEDGPNNIEREWYGYGAANKAINDIVAIVSGTNYRDVLIAYDGVNTTASGDAYQGMAVGDTVKLVGTSVDDDLVVANIDYERGPGDTTGVSFVRMRLTDTGAAYADTTQADITFTRKGKITSTKYLYLGTTASAHGLSFGDKVRVVCDPNPVAGESNFHCQDFVVMSVPSTTTFHIEIEEDIANTITGDIIKYTSINGATNTPPENPAIIRHGYASTAPDQDIYDRVQHRVAHARWMRDLPKSIWFQAQFGVIHPKPYMRSGKGSKLQHPYNTTQAATITGWNSDGSTDWNGLASNIDIGDSTINLDEPSMWYAIKSRGMQNFIVDLVDTETNESQYVIGTGITDPGFTSGLSWDNFDERFEFGGNHGFQLGQIIVHMNFQQPKLNGIHQVVSIPTTASYTTQKIIEFVPTRDSFSYMNARKMNDTGGWTDGLPRTGADPDQINITYEPSDNWTLGTFASSGSVTGGVAYHGNCSIQGVKGVKRQWKPEHTIYNLRQVDESNGYKHCFVGWADMRNDGTANADGGYRKNDYKLMLPTNENYSLNLTFADQLDANGNPDVFAELKIGEDADVWSFDSEVEPFTGNAWSALTGGSNEEPYATHLRNWDEKAGAVVLVDVSRFWNLNTMACGGRSGYTSGGIADFGDFETPTFGFPYLIDRYWKDATSSYKNSHDATLFPRHKNSLYFQNDASALKGSITVGSSRIYIDDNTQFDTSGYGTIIAEGGSNSDSEKIPYYFYWSGKGSIAVGNVIYDYLDNAFITTFDVVTGPKNAKEQLVALASSYSSGSEVAIDSKEFKAEGTELDTDFDKVRVYNTTAALYGMRLILNLEGTVVSPSQNSYFADDKIRIMQNLNLADSWATNATLPCISDINNVPIQRKNGGKNYGSSVDGRGQTMMSVLSMMQSKDGNDLLSDTSKSLSWLMGRDNRMEFRDSYDSKYAFTRSNLRLSNLNTQTGSKVTNVRVYYNGNSAFVDFPTPSTSTDLRWRVLNHPDLFNREEALSLAKQEYFRESTPRISITAEIAKSDNKNIMLGEGRFGYIADVFRKNYYNDAQSLSWWGNTIGGHPFCGMQNALDSGATTSKRTTYGITYAQLVEEDIPSEWGVRPTQVVRTSGSAVVDPTTVPGVIVISQTNTTLQFDLDGVAGTAVDVSAGAGWYQLPCSVTVSGSTALYKLSVYYDGTSFPSNKNTDIKFKYASTKATNDYYYWYGANSIANAVQVVSVGKGTNFQSATTTNELRMFIEVTGGTDSTDAVFKLHLYDFVFNETIAANTPPTLDVSSIAGNTSVAITGNGFFEVQVPSSYDSDQPYITVSANIDYLQELVRLRSNNSIGNKSLSSYGITLHNASTSSSSIFPLGMNRIAEMGAAAEERAAYYAPRLHIVRDVAYVPATTCTYTDTHIDMSSEDLVIKGIRWSQSARNEEKVILNLEKTETHYAYSLVSVLARPARPQSPPRPQPPPPKPRPPFGPIGAGGLGGSVAPAFNQSNQNIGNADPSSTSLAVEGMGMNHLSNSMIRAVRGKANFRTDTGSSGGSWSVLGSANTGVSSSFDRAIDGVEGSTTTSEGAAIATSDGFSLAGITDPETGAQGETHSQQLNIRVPNDTSTGFVSVVGSITLETITGGGNAEVTTTIECLETSSSVSSTKIVPQGSTRANITLMPPTYLNGAQTPNNTLKLTVQRKPAQGNDAAGYQTLTIHNLEVKMRRYNLPNTGQSNSFTPY